MFLFTTQNVINNSLWENEKDARWSFLEADEDKNVPATLNIKGVGIFKAPNITAAYKSSGHEGEIGSFSFVLPSANKGDQLRLSFVIALANLDVDSLYANDFTYKGKEFFIDFPYKGNAAETAAALEKLVKEAKLNVYSRKLWELEASGTTVTVNGVTSSQRFRDIKVERLHADGEYYREYYEDLEVDFDVIDGKDDFLTSDWITRNLRIPTSMRTRYTAANKHENPIEGALYDQYTIHYCAKRGQLGLNAVGQEVKSTTAHVLYIHKDYSAKFELELNKILAEAELELVEVKRNDGENP